MSLNVVSSKQMPPRPLHTFIYGPTRHWKTTTAATWPRPIFLSAGNEGGDTTLRHVPADVLVVQINAVKTMREAVVWIAKNHAQYGIQTVVVDSLTFYSDIVIHEILNDGKVTKPRMEIQDWGTLDSHLQKWLLPTLHELPLHVVWIALDETKKDSNGNVRSIEPMLYGKSASKIPASTDLIIHADQVLVPGSDGKPKTSVVMRTAPWNNAVAGGRFGDYFSDGVIQPHFDAINQRIGPFIGLPQYPNQVSALPAQQAPAGTSLLPAPR